MDAQDQEGAAARRFDSPALRHALGAFATGVAVVTAVDGEGRVVGLTVNSFSSVSLEPPLVLWSVGRNSGRHATFAAAQHWVVNVLRCDQESLASRFAQRNAALDGVALRDSGIAGVPSIRNCLATLACRCHSVTPVGDHSLLVGEVLAIHRSDGAPLLFFAGRYAGTVDHVAPAPADAAPPKKQW